MKRIPVREFRAVCKFQVEEKVQNEDLSYDRVFVTKFTDLGKLENSGGHIFRRDATSEPLTTHKLTIRYRSDFTYQRSMRVFIDGFNYTINRITQDIAGKSKYITFYLDQEQVHI